MYALDTEFAEDGTTIALLSLGLVAADGRTYYAQVVESDYARCNMFVVEHVIPAMTVCPGGFSKNQHWSFFSNRDSWGCVDGCPWRWKTVIAQEVRAFVGETPAFVTYYGAHDWVVLCQLYGSMTMLPSGWPMYATDLRAYLDWHGSQSLTQPDDMPHHALSDAHWIMETWHRYALHSDVGV